MKNKLSKYGFKLRCFSIILMLCDLSGLRALAQTLGAESGIPIQKEFLPADYKASGQNFAITADKRGVLYFANFSGVLEFDGTTWRTILTKERTKVNTLVTDTAGRVYVGTRGEIGYLQPNKLGDMQFVSLTHKLKPYHVDFPDVISSYSASEGVYFITANQIILWNGKKMQVQSFSNPLISAYYVDGSLFVQLKIGGLKCYVGGKFIPVEGGEMFTEQVTINCMIRVAHNQILIGSGNQGLFMWSPAGVISFNSNANEYLKTNLISYGTALKDGSFAFGTIHGGVVVITDHGVSKQIFSKSTTGLYDNNVHFVYEDDNHGFWIATEKHIARVEMPSYLSFYNNKKNVSGNVTGITRFQGKLFAGTDQGLLQYNTAQMRFTPVAGLQMPCQYLLRLSNQLLIATSNGIYTYNGSSAQNLAQGYAVSLHQSTINPNLIYAGLLNGVVVLQNSGGKLLSKGRLPGVFNEVREIAENGNDNLWLQVPGKGLINYSTITNKGQLYNKNKGLPYSSGNHLNMVGNQLFVGTVKGAYQYNASKDKFEHANIFKGDSTANYNWLDQMLEDKAGNLWTTSGNGTDVNSFKKTTAGFEPNNAVLAPVKDQQIFSIFPDDNGAGVWIGSADNLIFFDSRYDVKFSAVKPALIRSVTVNADSILFSGTYFNTDNLPAYTQNSTLTPTLNYKHNNISFTFTSPSATGDGAMQYKYYLQGFDTDTTTWTGQTQKEYSNLPAGKYTFHVQAKNIFGFKSTEATYTFTITKPFYQTLWAYLIYLLVLAGIVILVVRLRSQKLQREKEKLEGLIKERTAEVIMQKEAIESQSQELAGKNDELEKINLIVKSINAEINFDNLMQAILERAKIIRGAEKAAMLVFDKASGHFKFKASYGYNTAVLDEIEITPDDAQTRYLSTAEEIYEDIYFVKSVKSIRNDAQLASVNKAKSSLMMVIKLNHQIHAYMIMENWQKRNAFDERDFSLLKNLKEHFVAAVIKTELLEDIQDSLINLKNTQEQLIRQEKMASIGQLTKGIVDRILNPLNYINNFSSLSANLVDESLEVMDKPEMNADDKEEMLDILSTVKSNMHKVHEHGSSASRIVKGMEKILREKSNIFISTDINKLIETSVKQAVAEGSKEFPGVEVTINMNLNRTLENVDVLPVEMNMVLHNLISNSYYAVADRKKQQPDHQPQISISTTCDAERLEIKIWDNGKGILLQERKQLFQPFFTTKPTAKGTGLGLYLSQDIIKEHKGTITVETEESVYTEFTIIIPKNRNITLSN
ncbi:sensor histidine kinase [Mucilaginibacter terrae]|uniref:histidine kinase n=1 Tax=Mucilaginibacter terrae TaxID=1955052 RepID=A0ABU3GP17_9SPHI|nr:ATP-binding protein [Mucilaginibacter terrae]MDT3401521.1 signal transduction histidine kinase/ligand-binding sensor domain-containing protein [Mucilaginibacter terrae]